MKANCDVGGDYMRSYLCNRDREFLVERRAADCWYTRTVWHLCAKHKNDVVRIAGDAIRVERLKAA